MKDSVRISEELLSKLSNTYIGKKDGMVLGWIVGVDSQNQSNDEEGSNYSSTILEIVNCVHFDESFSSVDLNQECEDLVSFLPSGLSIVGSFFYSNSEIDLHSIFSITNDLILKLNESKTEFHFSKLNSSSNDTLVARVNENGVQFLIENGIKEIQIETCLNSYFDGFWDCFHLISFKSSFLLPLYLAASSDLNAMVDQVIVEIKQKMISSNTVLCIENLFSEDKKSENSTLIFDLFSGKEENENENENEDKRFKLFEERTVSFFKNLKNDKKMLTFNDRKLPAPTNLKIFFQKHFEKKSENSLPKSPIIHFSEKEAFSIQNFSFDVNIIGLMNKNTKFEYFFTTFFIFSIFNQLSCMKNQFKKNTNLGKKISAYIFFPKTIFFPITAIYPLAYGESENILIDIRKNIHKRFNFALDRPIFRISNAIHFNFDSQITNQMNYYNKRLKNVHVGLSSSGVINGKLSCVEGSYEYCHYMQDKFDDNGWGCAYRSLQTIFSWFKIQNYTNLPIPSHKEIQQTLVDIGDKNSSFVNSKQWIGAIELSYILDTILGVSCKILNVQSGADVATKAREFAHHFDTQGTPIMIGGGVLAYTLLGIDYNERTGDCAFLILDPHYTGAENLKSIQSGGWVAWRKQKNEHGKKFFLENAFYNFLLPQRPSLV